MTTKVLPQPKEEKKKYTAGAFFQKDLPRYFLLIATILVFVVFGLINPVMFNINNIITMFCTSALVGTMACAVVMAMSSGEMNMGVGAQATLAGTIVGGITALIKPANTGQEILIYVAAIFAALIASMAIGAGATSISLKFGVPSFITTLGFSNIAIGCYKLISGNRVLFSRYWATVFRFMGQAKIGGQIPVLFIVFGIIIVFLWILVDKTQLGAHIFAVGASLTTSKQVGINTKKMKWIAMLLSSALAALVGVLVTSREAQVRPTLGNELMLDAIAAAMLGATFLRPGRFNIQGTVIAAFLTTMIGNGIYTIGVSYEWKLIIQGLIFLFAVGFIARTRKEGLPGVRFGS